MLARLKRLLPRALFDMGTVGSGLFLRNLLRGFFKLLLAAFLAPGLMGVLRSVQAFFRIVSSLADFGLKYAMVTLVPSAIRRGDIAERDRLLMSSLGMRVVTIGAMVIVGNLFAEPLAAWILGDPSLTLYVRLAVLAAGGRLMWQFVSGYLTAIQNFGRLAFFLTTGPLLMLASAILLAAMGRLTLFPAVMIVLFGPTVAVLLWWPALDRSFVRISAWTRDSMAQIARFSRWIYLTNVASSLRGHLNPLLLKNPSLSGSIASGEVNAGLYGFGNDLANEMQMLSETIVTVLVPKASRVKTMEELRSFTARCYRIMPLLILPLIPMMFLAKPGLLLLSYLSETYLEYLPSLPVFYILYVGALLSIVTLPMVSVLYAMKLPQIEARVEAAMVPVLVIGGILLIPRFGAAGAALTILIQRTIFFVVILGYGSLRLRRASGPLNPPSELKPPDDDS